MGETNTLNQVGFQMLTVTGTPVALTRPTGLRPRRALISVSGGPIRWLAIPGSYPSGSYGTYVNAGGTIDWTDAKTDYAGLLDNVYFVKAGINDASLEVSYIG